MQKALIKFCFWLAAALSAYVLSYLLVTIRNCPALDSTDVVRFRTAIKYNPKEVTLGDFKVTVAKACTLNYVYVPLDALYYRFKGSPFTIGERISIAQVRSKDP
jgi:hypothetical protein